MFGDSSQEIFSAIKFFRARVSTSNEHQMAHAFVMGKARVEPMMVMTLQNMELLAKLLVARLK